MASVIPYLFVGVVLITLVVAITRAMNQKEEQ
jgi:hypothetical protein